MKKQAFVALALLVVLIFLWNKMYSDLKKEVAVDSEKYKARIGTKFILDKDTLTIVDYSYITKTFSLSNGVNVNEKIVLTQTVIE